MKYKSVDITQDRKKDEWGFKLYYEDNSGFEVTIQGVGYVSKHQVKIRATKKRNSIEKEGLK